MHSQIETLWRTATHHCELVVVGLITCRLRVWFEGRLHTDEEVFDIDTAIRRAKELRGAIASRLFPPPPAARY